MTDLAARLLEWRRHNQLSQAQAARVMRRHRVPVRVGTVAHAEQGRPIGKRAEAALQGFLQRHQVIDGQPAHYREKRPVRSEKDKAEMRAMRDHGMALAKIGEKFGMTESGVSHSLTRESKKISKKIQR